MYGIPDPQRLLQPFASLDHFIQELVASMRLVGSPEPEAPGPAARAEESLPPPPPPPDSPRQAFAAATPARAPRAAPPSPIPGSLRRPPAEPTASAAPDRASRSRVGFAAGTPIPAPSVRTLESGPSDVPVSTPSQPGDQTPVETPSSEPPGKPPYEKSWPLPDAVSLPVELDPPVLIGKITGGSGDTYDVDLYPDGKNGDPGDNVSVTILMIDSGETIPAGTWLCPIIRIDEDYQAQIPVWMDSEDDSGE